MGIKKEPVTADEKTRRFFFIGSYDQGKQFVRFLEESHVPVSCGAYYVERGRLTINIVGRLEPGQIEILNQILSKTHVIEPDTQTAQ